MMVMMIMIHNDGDVDDDDGDDGGDSVPFPLLGCSFHLPPSILFLPAGLATVLLMLLPLLCWDLYLPHSRLSCPLPLVCRGWLILEPSGLACLSSFFLVFGSEWPH